MGQIKVVQRFFILGKSIGRRQQGIVGKNGSCLVSTLLCQVIVVAEQPGSGTIHIGGCQLDTQVAPPPPIFRRMFWKVSDFIVRGNLNGENKGF